MVQRILDKQEVVHSTQMELMSRVKNIDEHLDQLNSKVATNVEKIHNLENAHMVVKAYATAVSFFIGLGWTAINFLMK